jgi:hypothetical protein
MEFIITPWIYGLKGYKAAQLSLIVGMESTESTDLSSEVDYVDCLGLWGA